MLHATAGQRSQRLWHRLDVAEALMRDAGELREHALDHRQGALVPPAVGVAQDSNARHDVACNHEAGARPPICAAKAWTMRTVWNRKLMIVHTATSTSPRSGACSSAATVKINRLGLRRA